MGTKQCCNDIISMVTSLCLSRSLFSRKETWSWDWTKVSECVGACLGEGVITPVPCCTHVALERLEQKLPKWLFKVVSQ